MSKKKSSTMTLRDFHGGSIPSDLPLPSAPGMVVERKNDRPGSGGWHRGYGGERAGFSRQTSGNFSRSVDERVSYFPNPANIGRNYDEDERKPVEGHSRRGQGVDSFEDMMYEHRQLQFERPSERFNSENRSSYTSSKYIADQKADRYPNEGISSAPVAPPRTQFEEVQKRTQSPSTYGGQEQSLSSGTGVQNVWTARNVESNRFSPPAYNESGGDGRVLTPGSRISTQVSALEKVSSGRWNSRILSPSNDLHSSSDYGQTQFDGERYSAGDQAVYNETTRSELSRSAYLESGRGIDIPPSRDSRFDMDRSVDGRGIIPSSVKYIDHSSVYDESSRKGYSAQRESAMYVGIEGTSYNELGHTRGHRDSPRVIGNEPVLNAESRSSSQMTSGRMRPEPSPRREYEDTRVMNANRDVAFDYERRGFNIRDGSVIGNSFGITSHSEGTHQIYNKQESGKGLSMNIKGREHLSHEISDVSKTGQANDRNRVPVFSDHEQGPAGKVQSPEENGCTVTSISSGSASVTLELESKNSAPERPKLKLLPRTKPIEVDFNEEPQQEKVYEDTEVVQSFGISPPSMSSTIVLPEVGGSKSDQPVVGVQRPKLSLKPRSQPVYVMPASGSVKERMSVFGGARPRELVLKERGVDESVIVGVDPILSPVLSMSGPRTEQNRTGGTEYNGEKQDKFEEKKYEGIRSEQTDFGNAKQLGRNDSGRLERNESRGRKDRIDVDRRDDKRGSDSRYSQEKRDPERADINKQESWRRSSDISSPQIGPQSSLIGVDGGGSVRVGIPSAAELAQAFSRSASFSGTSATTSTINTSSSGRPIQRSPMPRPPGPSLGLESPGKYKSSPRDVPFSRLTESLSPAPRDVYTQGGYRRANAF